MSFANYNAKDSSPATPYLKLPDSTAADGFVEANDALIKGIQSYRSTVRRAKKLSDSLGTRSDNQNMRKQLHDCIGKAKDEAMAVTKMLFAYRHFIDTVTGPERDHRRTQHKKLAKDFEKLVEDFEQIVVSSSTKLEQDSPLLQGHTPEVPHESDAARQMHSQGFQQQMDVEQGLLEERAQEMNVIQEKASQVQAIFTDLAAIVNDQQEEIDDIEDAVQNTAVKVEGGMGQLEKAEKHQKRGGKCLKYLLIVVVILALVAVGVAYATHK